MAFQLKPTGQALDLLACVRVDEDGVTLKEFVNGWTSTWDEVSVWTDNNATFMTIDDPVIVGSGTWKGTTFPYFETFADGSFGYHGVRFAGIPTPNSVSDPGFSIFAPLAGMNVSGGGGGFSHPILEWNGGGDGVDKTGATGSILWHIGVDYDAATTSLPTDLTTKFSYGLNYQFNANQAPDPDYFFGLESGSVAGDGNYNAQARSLGNFTGIGGGTGSGRAPGKYFALLIFNSPRTLAQMQALHNNWHGELFETAAAGEVGQVLETDTAFSVAHARAYGIAPVTETDIALAVAHNKEVSLGQAEETALALALVHAKEKEVGLVAETNLALSVLGPKLISVGLVSESNLALTLTPERIYSIGLPIDTSLSLAIDWSKARVVNVVNEIDIAQPLQGFEEVVPFWSNLWVSVWRE